MRHSFEYPRDLRFTCSRCGDCCRNANIMLSPAEVAALEALDRSAFGGAVPADDPVVVVDPASKRRRLARHADGACVFLGKSDQCLLHEHLGAQAKPLMCRLYPFNFYPVGERITVDCAFSCRAVSEARGASLDAQHESWSELLAQIAEVGSGGEGTDFERLLGPTARQHRLKSRVPLSAEVLWELEQTLLHFLEIESLGLLDRVRCLLQFVRLATSGDPSTAAAAQLRQALAQGLPRSIVNMPAAGRWDRSQRALFFQWLYLALNPGTANQDLLQGSERRREEERRIAAGNRYQRPDLAPFVDNRELDRSFAEIGAVDPGYVEGEGATLVVSFLRAKIVGQRYLLAGEQELPLFEAVPKFLLVYPMAIWTAQALAAERGSDRVGERDLRGALRLLDRSLGQLATSRLPRKQAKACDFIMAETDFVVHSRNELFGDTAGAGDDDTLALGEIDPEP